MTPPPKSFVDWKEKRLEMMKLKIADIFFQREYI